MKSGSMTTLFRVVLLGMALVKTAFCGIPVWSIVPAAGSNPHITIPSNESGVVTYVVTNNSHKYHQLAMLPIAGVVNSPAICYLSPRGMPGSSCNMAFTITPTSLAYAVAGGPWLCQVMEDGTPNRNQCYQPAEADRLLISHGLPGATIVAQPTTLVFAVGQQRVVIVTNTSTTINAENINVTLPAGSPVSAENHCPPVLPPGGFCPIVFSSTAPITDVVATIQGSNTNAVPIDITVTNAIVIINALPQVINMANNSTATVDVRNLPISSGTAIGITITPTSQSGITTISGCTDLAVNATCSIQFNSTTPVTGAQFVIQATNSNAVTVTVNVLDTVIELTGFDPANEYITVGGAPLILDVTNSAQSLAAATNVQVTDKSACPNVTASYSNCASVAPGATCEITLNSATPYIPCTISIAGTNTNTITTRMAFSYLGGLVFTTSGSSGKVVSPTSVSRVWSNNATQGGLGSASISDGSANSTAISFLCVGGCPAVNYCVNTMGSPWFLPALNELVFMDLALCQSGVCRFGINASTAWSSTWVDSGLVTQAYAENLSQINNSILAINTSHTVYCIRDY